MLLLLPCRIGRKGNVFAIGDDVTKIHCVTFRTVCTIGISDSFAAEMGFHCEVGQINGFWCVIFSIPQLRVHACRHISKEAREIGVFIEKYDAVLCRHFFIIIIGKRLHRCIAVGRILADGRIADGEFCGIERIVDFLDNPIGTVFEPVVKNGQMCCAGGYTAVGENEQRLCPSDIGLEGNGVPAVIFQALDCPFRAEFCGLPGMIGN